MAFASPFMSCCRRSVVFWQIENPNQSLKKKILSHYVSFLCIRDQNCLFDTLKTNYISITDCSTDTFLAIFASGLEVGLVLQNSWVCLYSYRLLINPYLVMNWAGKMLRIWRQWNYIGLLPAIDMKYCFSFAIQMNKRLMEPRFEFSCFKWVADSLHFTQISKPYIT